MENWYIILCIAGFVIIYFFALVMIKINHATSKSISKKLRAKVVEFKLEHGSPLGDDGSRYYAYVQIEMENKDVIFQKLEHEIGVIALAPFKKGEIINVFWNKGKLFYWNSYQRGIFKLLPSKWRS
ncbi:MAG: hypothetical protein Wins2KO_32410 [Winogradskyella sp.]